MTRTDLQKETRNWFSRGCLPPRAAEVRRQWAEMFPMASPWHLAVADEWDRITETQKPKVIAAYKRELDQCSRNLSKFEPSSPTAQYWLDRILEIDYKLMELDPTHER